MTASSEDYSDDPWRMGQATAWQVADRGQVASKIEVIQDVEPLDVQFGVLRKNSVPEALYDSLFGQVDPTEAEIAAAGGDVSRVPPMQSYAILDAAKVANLPELLGRSALAHRCMFKGNAYDELADVGPWIVRLEEGETFTRNLFAYSDAPWHLWGKEPGIYVRSRASLDELWRHFRKLVRVQDGEGRWYFFRFWEARPMAWYMQSISNSTALSTFWSHRRGSKIVHSIVAIDARTRQCSVCQFDTPSEVSILNQKFQIGTDEKQAFAAQQRDDFMTRLCGHLANKVESFSRLTAAEQVQECEIPMVLAHKHGLKSEKAVADFVLAYVLSDGGIASDPQSHAILASRDHELDRASDVLKRAASLPKTKLFAP